VIYRLTCMAPALAIVLAACGCESGSADRWLKEQLNPPPTSARVVQIEGQQADARREAVTAVAVDRSMWAVPSVVKLFTLVATTDADPMVRSAAVRGLVNMQGDGIAEALSSVLLRDKNAFVRCDAAHALGNRMPPEGEQALITALSSDTSSDVRLAAAEELHNFQDKAAADALVAALRDHNVAIAYRAWEGLRYMTCEDLPREEAPWKEFFVSTENPFADYGKPPLMPQGANRRPVLTQGLTDFFNGLFAKDIRQAELE